MKAKILIILFSSLLIIVSNSNLQAKVIFQDNFDDHSDWSPAQPVYPNTSSNNASDGGTTGATACTGCPDGTAKYRGYYIASSSWDGYKGNNTLSISSANARGGSGKALTVWMEPIDTTKCDGGTRWCSDGQLAISLPQSYNELFIRFYIKFQPDWKWSSSVAIGSEKFMHVSHLHEFSGVSMWKFFTSGNHFPLFVFNMAELTYYGTEGLQFRLHPRFQSSYNPGSAVPTPSYLTSNDYEGVYAYGGTGRGGRKTFEEYIGDGNWHCIEIHLKGNSGIGTEDGEWQLWVDETSLFHRTNIAWADSVYNSSCANCINPPSNFVGWNWVSIGGNGYNRVYPESTHTEQWYAIDDLVISTTDVGPSPQPPKNLRIAP